MMKRSEYEKRHFQVLKVLSILNQSGAVSKPVFFGGSAVQVFLKNPRRLSIDLDIHFAGDAEKLIAQLSPEFVVSPRPEKNEKFVDLFHKFNTNKDSIQVKIDISKFELLPGSTPFVLKRIKDGSLEFECKIAPVDYLLASKFSTLATSTVGRFSYPGQNRTLDFLKDVFDINSLLDEFGVLPNTWIYFSGTVGVQNKIRKANFSENEVIDDAVVKLFDYARRNDVLKGAIGNFSSQYLFQDYADVQLPDFWRMFYRVASYLSIAKVYSLKPVASEFVKLEEWVAKNENTRELHKTCKVKLESEHKEFSKEHLHELLMKQPKALLYLYACFYSVGRQPINSDTPGVWNPGFK